jgi:hypothetical protein
VIGIIECANAFLIALIRPRLASVSVPNILRAFAIRILSKLIAVLDTQELADASDRLEGGYGLRGRSSIVKEAAN